MVADWAARRAGDDKVVLAAENIRSERAAHGLERPVDIVLVGRRSDIAPRPLGKGAEVILNMIFGQRLGPPTEGDLSCEGQSCQIDQLLVLDEDAVQRDPPARG